MIPAGDRDRVELDGPESPKDLEHPVEASRERPRRHEEVPRDEKATRRLSRDLHLKNSSCEGLGTMPGDARTSMILGWPTPAAVALDRLPGLLVGKASLAHCCPTGSNPP